MQSSISDTSWPARVITEICKQLEDESDSATAQLLGCGEDNFNRLLSATQNSVAGTLPSSSCETLEGLANLAYTKLSREETEICWRRMYTDTHILLSLLGLASHTALLAIGHLDRAIIIAGAAGRLDLILSLISNIQSSYVQSRHFTLTPSRIQRNCFVNRPVVLHTSRHAIPCLDSPPSFHNFQTRSHASPFILRNFASDWPALNKHPWSSASYLRSVAGPGRLVPVEVGTDYRADDWTQKLMSWDEFLASLDLDGQPAIAQKDVLYLAQHNLLMQFPELNSDITIPDYAYSSLPAPPDYPKYRPPNNEDRLIVNGWLGPQGTVSPAHTDPYYNLFVQVVGRKTVWLTSPALSRYMYPYAAQQSENPTTNITNPSMSNTSHVDVFGDNSGGDRYTEFEEHVITNQLTMHATLEPGDLLFLPAGWWHAMRAEDTSFSVSMWF